MIRPTNKEVLRMSATGTSRTASSTAGGKPAPAVLGTRDLNRALLARQMLLHRVKLPALDAIERLVGMQAQAPLTPYFGLWTRIEGFSHDELSRLIMDKSVVRIALMRSTLHLVSARDCLQLRPWVQPALDRSLQGTYGKRLAGIDAKALAAAGRALVEAQPLTFSELDQLLGKMWPDREPDALTAAIRTMVPLVQLPPRGIWGKGGQATHTSAEAWLDRPLAADRSQMAAAQETIVRYLAAFGPASVKDIQTWSGVTRLREAIEPLRPQLVAFRNAQGVELFDVPAAPRPDPETPAPPRFLSEFDNMLLSYEDRTRIIDETYRKRVCTVNGLVRATILVDGFVAGTWKIAQERSTATLFIEPFRPLSVQERDALTEEGTRLLNFAAAECRAADIVFVANQGGSSTL
jgi:hypothetical protein